LDSIRRGEKKKTVLETFKLSSRHYQRLKKLIKDTEDHPMANIDLRPINATTSANTEEHETTLGNAHQDLNYTGDFKWDIPSDFLSGLDELELPDNWSL
jgi:hypothetical protein